MNIDETNALIHALCTLRVLCVVSLQHVYIQVNCSPKAVRYKHAMYLCHKRAANPASMKTETNTINQYIYQQALSQAI